MFDSQPTKFDLCFKLFGFPVRVHPLFWLITALLGRNALDTADPVPNLLIWIACVFVTILLHELGHTFAYRWFGSPAEIRLIAFFGLAIGRYPPTNPWKRIVISLAGPAAGFLFYGLLYGISQVIDWSTMSRFVLEAFQQLMFINLVWNILNLLPIYPLDGGKVAGELCVLAGARQPNRLTYQISIVTSLSIVLYGLFLYFDVIPIAARQWIPPLFAPSLYISVWFVIFAFMNYQLLQQTRSRSIWNDSDDDTPPWRRR